MSHYREKTTLREWLIGLGYALLVVFAIGLLLAFNALIGRLG